eukprot:552475-Pelagomonas_calceolata.AAC.2
MAYFTGVQEVLEQEAIAERAEKAKELKKKEDVCAAPNASGQVSVELWVSERGCSFYHTYSSSNVVKTHLALIVLHMNGLFVPHVLYFSAENTTAYVPASRECHVFHSLEAKHGRLGMWQPPLCIQRATLLHTVLKSAAGGQAVICQSDEQFAKNAKKRCIQECMPFCGPKLRLRQLLQAGVPESLF